MAERQEVKVMTEQEFEKNQPETGESTQSVVPSANETAEEQHQSEMRCV